MKSTFFAERALLDSGWSNNVRFEVTDGNISKLETNSNGDNASLLSGPVLPTMPNLHSHAFQRVMAGLAEVFTSYDDSFWSWRDLMYRIVGSLNPDQVRIIASYLYVEMLKTGYSQVGEFHYLFHDRDGSPYQNRTEIAEQILAAAETSGIGVTFLPALYSYSGFGEQAANQGQRRFINTTEQYLNHHQQLAALLSSNDKHNLGFCFHSLRAVSETQIRDVLKTATADDVIHIHIAEQQKEVNDCLEWSGYRPVEWLSKQIGLDQRWCLVHATHLNDAEIEIITQANAVAGLCPTTEANLGDGIFEGVKFSQQNGIWGVGSDSHVTLSISEELRALEYSQRLRDQQRNRLHNDQYSNIGDYLFHSALQGGNQACGVNIGLAEGCRADFMALDNNNPMIAGTESDQLLNRWVFACKDNLVSDVYVAGEQKITAGQHQKEQAINKEFLKLIKEL